LTPPGRLQAVPHAVPRAAAPASRIASWVDAAPAPLLFVAGAVSQYAGAAIAVLLFAAVPAAGVAWLRVVAAAVFLAAWRRPWRDGWSALRPPAPPASPAGVAAGRRGSAARVALVVAFGAALAGMNLTFYLAIERLPLGTTVAIEFLGPIVVAAAGTRTRRDLGALLLALAGVALLAEVERGGSPAGLAFAFAAAALWAAYIVLGARVAGGGHGTDGLAAGMVAGAVVIAPLAAPPALPALTDPALAAACLSVGVLSSVVPYALDQRVLTRLSPGRFALLLSLLPATAAVVGALVLGQVPAPVEALGIALVVAAVAVRSRH
jgi:inner membrane transporter RhtA